MIMKEYKYVEVKFEAKGVLFHSASEPKEIIKGTCSMHYIRYDVLYQLVEECPMCRFYNLYVMLWALV